MIDRLKAALEKHAAIHGYANDAARILKGEIDALDPPYEGAGATTVGNDALLDWIETTYQVQLEETRLKRWQADTQEGRLQQERDDAAREAEQDAIAADRQRIADLKAEKGADWWIGVDHIEADVPAGVLRDRLLEEFCLADFKPSPPHYGEIADDAADWKKEIHRKLVAHWGQGVMNDFQTRLGAEPKKQPGPGLSFGQWAGHHLYPTSTPGIGGDCNLQMWIVAEDEDRADRYEVTCDGWTGVAATPSGWTHYEDLYCLPATLRRRWAGDFGAHTVTVQAFRGGELVEEISRTVWLRPFFMSYRKKEGGEWHEQNVVSDDDSTRFDEYIAWRAEAEPPTAPEEMGGDPAEPHDADAPPAPVVLPASVEAPQKSGSLRVAAPAEWQGRGKVQVAGGAKARDAGKFSGLRIDPRLFAADDPDRTFSLSWSRRWLGTLEIVLEWQPVAGDGWQPSDGGPVEPRVLTVVNE